MRTTITIPDALVAEVDALVGQDGITTRNQLIVEALQNWVELRKEAQIDDEFMAMARDVDYITETLAIEGEFASSDREVAILNND
jgi:metal-responsive CopG/Arc/MetJ family transcriptional regulator